MRYRPFNQAGLAVSAITLTLDETPMSRAGRIALVFAALEAGINSFELASLSPDCTAAMRAAIDAAGRNVLVVTLRPPGGQGAGAGADADMVLDAQVGACLEQIGAQRFDAVLLDADGPPSSHDAARLNALRAQGLTRMVGVVCGRGGPTLDLLQAGCDVVATPFGLRADAGLRKRMRALVESNITLMGYDFDDVAEAAVQADAPKGLGRFFKRAPVAAEAGAYDFLRRTPDWTAQEIALAYALTEPLLATVRVQTTDIATLERLALTVERELPTSAAAQIEMARFSAPA